MSEFESRVNSGLKGKRMGVLAEAVDVHVLFIIFEKEYSGNVVLSYADDSCTKNEKTTI